MERLTHKSVLEQIDAKNDKQFADARKAWNCERREISLDCYRTDLLRDYASDKYMGD